MEPVEAARSSAARRWRTEAPVAPRFVRRLCLLGLLAGGAALAQVGARAVVRGWPDFEYFYKAGTSLVARGTLDPGYDMEPGHRIVPRGGIDWYLPFVPRLMAGLAWLPPTPAGLIWLALNLTALAGTLRLVGRRLTGLPPVDWPVTQLVPFFMLFLFWWWEYRLNQIDVLTLLLMTGSFACWRWGRPWTGGFWLGLAMLIKLTPGLLVVWFLLKRQFRVVAAALVTVALAGPLADVVVFGPRSAWDAYRGWAERALVCGSQRGLILAQREMDWRNQALGAVASRWLHATNYATHYDNDPRLSRDPRVRTLNVADLRPATVAGLVTAVQMASLAALLWLLRRPACGLTEWQLRLEWALCLLAMLWFMPVLRAYHFVWTYPLVAVLAGAAHHRGWRDRWTRITLGCLTLVVTAQAVGAAAVRGPQPRLWLHAGGVLLTVLVVLAVPAVWSLVRLGRNSTWLPAEEHPGGGARRGFATETGVSEDPGAAIPP